MIKSFDFFFDFVSPYSYLAHKQIRKIELENEIKINYKPILLGGLHKVVGVTAAAFIPAKAKYMIKDCKMVAEKYHIKFKFNTYFPISSLTLMRGIFFAEKKKKLSNYVDCFFDAYWQNGLDLSDDKVLNSLLDKLEINFNEFKTFVSDQKIKNKLIEKTNDAVKLGIFGAPSFMVNNKLFWGQDRLEFALIEAKK